MYRAAQRLPNCPMCREIFSHATATSISRRLPLSRQP
jgi:hypothetical protein